MSNSTDATELLLEAGSGSAAATDRLFSLLYEELSRIARNRLGGERTDHTLQAGDLVHEAFVRMVDQTRCDWRNRAQFLAVAAQVMRRILVDHARRKGRVKRGGDWQKVSLTEAHDLNSERTETIIASLNEALERLAETQPEKARIVELRFFAGLSQEECAHLLGISVRSVARHWEYAQAWLYRHMTESASSA